MEMRYVVTEFSQYDLCHVIRYQMQDWDGKLLAEANAKKHTLPSYFPITYRYPIPRDWDSTSKVCVFSMLIELP